MPAAVIGGPLHGLGHLGWPPAMNHHRRPSRDAARPSTMPMPSKAAAELTGVPEARRAIAQPWTRTTLEHPIRTMSRANARRGPPDGPRSVSARVPAVVARPLRRPRTGPPESQPQPAGQENNACGAARPTYPPPPPSGPLRDSHGAAHGLRPPQDRNNPHRAMFPGHSMHRAPFRRWHLRRAATLPPEAGMARSVPTVRAIPAIARQPSMPLTSRHRTTRRAWEGGGLHAATGCHDPTMPWATSPRRRGPSGPSGTGSERAGRAPPPPIGAPPRPIRA